MTVIRNVLAEAMREDFWLFLKYGFGAETYCKARPDEDWLDEAVHRPLCDWFDKSVKEWERRRASGERRPMKLLACIPRGFGKSTLITAAGGIWLHLRNPELVTLISSYGEDRSTAFLGVIKNVFEGKSTFGWWRDVYGSWEPDQGREWKVESIVHSARRHPETRDPSFEVTSINKGATGGRPDVFMLDDPISEDKIGEDPNHVVKAVRHFRSMEFAIKTNGLWVVCLTRKMDADVAGSILMEDGVEEFAETGMRPRDFEYRMGGPWRVFFMSARDGLGEPVLPRVWPEARLQEVERTNPIRFASELMNMPAEGQHMMLKPEDVSRLWVEREALPTNLRISIHCDTAFKTKERMAKGDESVIAVVGHTMDGSGLVYFLEARASNRWSSEKFFDELVAIVQRVKKEYGWPFVITDEKEIAGKEGLFEPALASHFHAVGLPVPRLIQIARGGIKKETRVRLAADYWLAKKVRLVHGAEGMSKLVHQMVRYGVTDHDDVADAFADAFSDGVYVPERRAQGGEDLHRIRLHRPLDHLLYGRHEDKEQADKVFVPWFN